MNTFTTEELADLTDGLERGIEQLGEKLEYAGSYPGQYDPEDLEQMEALLVRLEALQTKLHGNVLARSMKAEGLTLEVQPGHIIEDDGEASLMPAAALITHEKTGVSVRLGESPVDGKLVLHVDGGIPPQGLDRIYFTDRSLISV